MYTREPTLNSHPPVPTKSHKNYNQQKDQNRLWGEGFQYWRCSPCMCQANWMSLDIIVTLLACMAQRFTYWRCSPCMCQANWMSLGIIVTLLACMAQRFTSSMSPIKYASTASCRHKMACPWKCRSYLPTSRAISWTNHEKGHFNMRSSVLFWNWQILWRATIPGWCFWVFFSFPAVKNSFLGALPFTVGWSFFLAGSSPPDIDGPASTAKCWIGNDCGDLPTSPSHSASQSSWLSPLNLEGFLVPAMGVHQCWGPWASTSTITLVWTSVFTCVWVCIIILTSLLPSPLCGVLFVLTILKLKRESANQVPEQSCESLVAAILNF